MTRGLRLIRDGVTAFALLALVALIAAKLNDAAKIEHMGAFHAADGDSLTLGAERLRLEGIDAPELNQSCERAGKAWSCGRAAREALQGMVLASGTLCQGSLARPLRQAARHLPERGGRRHQCRHGAPGHGHLLWQLRQGGGRREGSKGGPLGRDFRATTRCARACAPEFRFRRRPALHRADRRMGVKS